ncbi:MAG: EcsC family protein [Clostridiales bacterium]|nr:EcsC family protein [Clostridiales bacterium]
MENKVISQDEIMKALDTCYQKVVDGIGKVSPPVEVMAQNYLEKNTTASLAAKSMINAQIVKCTTSGFVTGFGGFITLPVSVPANVGSVLYVQMRMIACTAYMAGYDLKSDQVQTLVYACLAGVAVNEILKKTGIKIGEKLAVNLIKKIPGSVLTKINQKVGFRFITKFGEKGLINLGKLVPGVGAVISGGLDLVETKIIGDRAYKWFFKGDFSVGIDEHADSATENPEIKDVDYLDT